VKKGKGQQITNGTLFAKHFFLWRVEDRWGGGMRTGECGGLKTRGVGVKDRRSGL